ncbi:MAG: phosphatidate cytidylyltransferase [Xanthobacteraceae bacterium]|nr:phosphatidate cytidylyltransferase [Xanthobacteraceae bacterium]
MVEDRAAAAPGTEPGSRNLLARVVAALVLAPVTIAIAYAGGWWWAALVTAAAIGLFVEWLTMVGALQTPWTAVAGSAALAAAGVAVAANRGVAAAAAMIAVGVVATMLSSAAPRAWVGGGVVYAGLALVASVLVRHDADFGLVALIFVLLVVWVTDIGAYFAGRGIGGPKLWPRVSPKKTWAGAVGGLAASLVVAGAAAAAGVGKTTTLLLLAMALSVVSQLGDLFESAVKRNFGVKDSSHIIPGHGGLLDRLDGFVAAIVVAAVVGLVRGGVDGVGRGLLMW